MKRFTKQCIVAVIAVAGFFAVMGIAGTQDWADQVVYTMPEAAYYSILDTLGDDCSTIAIAEEYMSKKEYYDSMEY